MISAQQFAQQNPNSKDPTFGEKIGGVIKQGVQDLGRPIFEGGAMIGNALVGGANAAGLLNPQEQSNLKNMQQNGMQNTPFGTVPLPTVDTSKSPLDPSNLKGIEQSAGEGVQLGTMLGGGDVPSGSGILGGAARGAESGAIVGAGQGAGQSMQNNESGSQILANTAIGGLSGAAVGAIAGGVGNIWEKANAPSSYDTNVANATKVNNQAGTNAVNALTEASGTLQDVKTGLGNQFSEAPNIIAKTDPNASVTLPAEIVDKLNALKDTKAWSLPASIREPGLPSDIQNIGSGEIKLNPTQTQDLITQLNDLKFNSKGDVVINQQASSLVNDVKDLAQSGLGHVTDAQGNSVWARAYQDYQQGMDARDQMSSLIPTTKTPGGMLDPTDVDKSISKMTQMMKTPEGRAALIQGNAQFKLATGYDILNDPMGSIQKLIDSNSDLVKAQKGNWGHQLMQSVKSPSAIGRRVLYMSASLLGIATLGSAFRKQIGNFIAGQ